MPLWNIYYSENTLTVEDKAGLAAQITPIYTSIGLPDFYVNVLFHPLPPSDLYIAAKPHNNFMRVQIQHIALHFENATNKKKSQDLFLRTVDKILGPVCQKYGMDWEYHCFETPRELWKIAGLVPPGYGSAEEKEWFANGKPSPAKTVSKL
jgi:phenylpyruvate tautomerase PptA (4-oxalocrotonate tautomerase family)